MPKLKMETARARFALGEDDLSCLACGYDDGNDSGSCPACGFQWFNETEEEEICRRAIAHAASIDAPMVESDRRVFRIRTTENEVFWLVAADHADAARLARRVCEDGTEIGGAIKSIDEPRGFLYEPGEPENEVEDEPEGEAETKTETP